MDDMESKLSSILNDPEMMGKIMAMAQSLGSQHPPQEPPKPENPPPIMPQIDLALVQKLSGFARQSGIDPREQALLGALQAYLTGDRVVRLERAMRAAKMAKLATTMIGQQGLLSGR